VFASFASVAGCDCGDDTEDRTTDGTSSSAGGGTSSSTSTSTSTTTSTASTGATGGIGGVGGEGNVGGIGGIGGMGGAPVGGGGMGGVPTGGGGAGGTGGIAMGGMGGTGGVPPPPVNDTCPGTVVALDVGASTVLDGTILGAADDYESFCADMTITDDNVDVAYQVTLNGGGLLQLDLDDHLGSNEFDGAVSLRKIVCTARNAGDNCSNLAAVNESLDVDLAAGTYWVVIEGANGQTGDFTLSAALAAPVCGNGIVNNESAGEECDLVPNDPAVCNPPGSVDQCKFAGPVNPAVEDCPGLPVAMPVGSLDLTGPVQNTCTNVDNHVGTCAGPNVGGKDAVYHIVPASSGTLTATVGNDASGQSACVVCPNCPDCGVCWAPVVYARKGACSGATATQVACQSDPTFASTVMTVTVPVTAGEDVWLFVDGFTGDAFYAGTYILELTLAP
jgi:hypothetical protein